MKTKEILHSTDALLDVCQKKKAAWNFDPINENWYQKYTDKYEMWRTRMYGFGSFRLFDKRDLFTLSDSIPPLKELFGMETGVKNVNMYVHIPFCKMKCPFCFYQTDCHYSDEILDRYVDALLKNISLFKETVPYNLNVNNIHFGGGTPTLIGPSRMEVLLKGINNLIDVPENSWSIETSPDAILADENLDTIKIMKEHGVTRISIGVQSFDDNVLKTCGRNHDAYQAEKAIGLTRECGFDNINIDLLLGLPSDNRNSWWKTLEKVREIQTESVSLYYIKWLDYFKEQGNLYKQKKKKPDLFASNEEILTMNLMVLEYLNGLGYTQNRPCSWTKKTEHFSYPEYSDILPIGASSFSYYGDYHVRNISETKDYINRINNNVLPFQNECAHLSREFQIRRRFSSEIQFLNFNGLDLESFKKDFGIEDINEYFKDTIETLMLNGLIEQHNKKVVLTEKGSVCADEVVKFIFTN